LKKEKKVEKFAALLSPVKIGSLDVKNRIVMPAMGTHYLEYDGSVNERFIAYMRARARGGTGLLITEAAFVHPSGKLSPRELGVHRDEMVPGLKKLVGAVHADGAKICIQLGHAGRQTYHVLTEQPLLAPSAIACPLCKDMPVEMSKTDIDGIIDSFGEAARRAKEAGFDAVEVHGAHGYLLNQFLSAYSNKRSDEYGGTLENRARLPLAVVKKIKSVTGPDYPVIYRMSAMEFVADGLTVEESAAFSAMLVGSGIDAIHVSGGVYESAAMTIGPACIPQGVYADMAAAIRGAIGAKVPVIVVHRIKDPVMAEGIIASGKADMVAMGRALLADEELPLKVSQGRAGDVRKCIACNQGCIDKYLAGEGITCLGNARTGREAEYDSAGKASAVKKLVVIGGGPAGLETARVAALRGHKVVLFEKSPQLGGQMKIAAVPPFKAEINDLTDFLISQAGALGVEIRLAEEITENKLKEISPDAVVLATGSQPIVPPIKGIGRKGVFTANDILAGAAEAQGTVAIVGGGMVGCETAEYLADKGLQVTVIEMLEEIAPDMGMINKAMLQMRMYEKGIKVSAATIVREITDTGMIVERMGKTETLAGVDTIVLATGSRPDDTLQDMLVKMNIPFRKIGDCAKAGKIIDAIHEGFIYAYSL
jgi:2,4-dienoyl-CoA reductase-like NADH-dependent reductase (Old Yellow Enzyme family)/thioredoxin reductase